jgi:sigma-B regulation protein RsbU (phosphoserine phosphatase)
VFGIESYIAVPLNRRDGSYFGTLCALDPLPAQLSDDDFEIFSLLSSLIAFEIEADEQHRKRMAEVCALEDIIAIAAHDLRQPLAALTGRAELLMMRAARGATVEDMLVGLKIMVEQGRRASRLSDVLLDVAQIEVGGLALSQSECNIVEIARLALEETQTAQPAHTLVLESPVSLVIRADERRLGQVLRNLLDNATKYAPADSGPIVLSIAPHAIAELVHMEVRDHGPGVNSTDLEHLFERNYRTSDATKRGVRGSGLGLYVVQRIIALHGGLAWAEHAPGGGLQICFDLPFGM